MAERMALNIAQSSMKRGTKLGCFLLIRAIVGAVAIRFNSTLLIVVYALLTLCIPYIMWRIYQFFRYEEIEGSVMDMRRTFVYYAFMAFYAVTFSLFFLFIYLCIVDNGGVISGFIELLTRCKEELALLGTDATASIGTMSISDLIDTAIMEYQKMTKSDLVLNLLPGQMFWGIATAFLLALISHIQNKEI